MPLTFEQFKQLRSRGLSPQQIAGFESGTLQKQVREKTVSDIRGEIGAGQSEYEQAGKFLQQPAYKQLFSKQIEPEIFPTARKETARFTTELPVKTALSLSELPETFLKGRATQRTYNVPLVGPTKSIQSEAETTGGEIIEGQKPLSAIAGPISEAVLGPIDLALGVKGAVGLGKQGIKSVKAFSASRKAAQAIKDAKAVDSLANTIVQGRPEDIAKAKSALLQIDTKDIKTYQDLRTALDDKVTNLSNKLDETLSTAKQKVGIEQLTHRGHNYIDDALTQLDDFYTKTNNVAGKANISQLRSQAQRGGLTVKEMNDIAKLHGQEISAFNASGQAASGLSKQAAENTRKGVKATAREFFDDPVYQAADEQLSGIIRTRDLVDDVVLKVNQLAQKVKERGFGEKVGRLIFQVVDKFTGGGLKGFVQSFIPRGQGLKVMNALDLEKELQKNLKTLQSLGENLPEAEVEKRLLELLSSGAKPGARFVRASVAESTTEGRKYMQGKSAAIQLGEKSNSAIVQSKRNAVAANTASGRAYMEGKAKAIRFGQKSDEAIKAAIENAKKRLQSAQLKTTREQIQAELARMEAKLKAVQSGRPELSTSRGINVRDINP